MAAMCAAAEAQDNLIAADELEEQQACQQFALSNDQLVGLHARRLSWTDSRKLGVRYNQARLYKTADVEALTKQLKQKKKSGKRKHASFFADATEEKWDLEDTGGGGTHEIDEYKASEHFKLSAERLDRLPYRHLSREESKALGKRSGRVRVYKLQAVCQLVTDLQTSVNEQYESAVVRREQLQEAREAKAFEAASKAKALVKTWKKPQLSAGQTSLPMDLWGHVLEQMLPGECLWDLQAAAQQLCTVSLVSKGMYAAVQQQGWPKLCQLLSPLPPPPAMQRGEYQSPNNEKGQLPSSPDVLVTDPASLRLPELRAACNYFSLQATGVKAEVMGRILARFGLSRPCNAPMLVVAYTSIYAKVVLAGLQHVIYRADGESHIIVSHFGYDARIADKHVSLCEQLRNLAQSTLEGKQDRWNGRADACMPTEARSTTRGLVRAAAPQLQETFGGLSLFLQLAGCDKSLESLRL